VSGFSRTVTYVVSAFLGPPKPRSGEGGGRTVILLRLTRSGNGVGDFELLGTDRARRGPSPRLAVRISSIVR